MRVLFLGDIVGKVGRKVVTSYLPALVENHAPDFIIANGENAAAGVGITAAIADELFAAGIDGITLGNHAFQKRDIASYLDAESRLIRPANFPPGTPGRGWTVLEKAGAKLGLVNLCGRVFMAEYDDPFRGADAILDQIDARTVVFDFHAEATSEKAAFAWYVDGRAGAVVGTHTHVQTADERVLPEGTAFITDVGMCGPQDSVIGMDREIILRRFLTLMPERFEVAGGAGVICGVVIDFAEGEGNATGIQRVFWKDLT